jgi:hypothetical protein
VLRVIILGDAILVSSISTKFLLNIHTKLVPKRINNGKKNTLKLLSVSVFFHVLVILVVFIFSSEKNKPISINTPIPLKSYLYKLPVKKLVAPEVEIPSIPDVTNLNKKAVAEKEVPSEIDVPAQEQLSVLTSNKTDILPKTVLFQKTPKGIQARDPLSITKDVISPTTSIIFNNPYKTLVTKHLQTYQDQYVLEQALEYSKLKMSPIINTKTSVNTITPNIVAPEVKVDCASRVNQVFAFIYNLTNGSVRCRNNNQFQYYIDRRLKKSIEKDSDDTKDR